MKLACPKCAASMPAANINVAEGICVCPECNEAFRIASVLRGDAMIARVPKPAGSRVELLVERDSLGLMLSPGGAKATGWSLLIFALFWNAITQNHRPAYGIGLGYGTKTLKFGSSLKEDERRWLMGELRDFLGITH